MVSIIKCHHHLPTILTLLLTRNNVNGEGAQKLLLLVFFYKVHCVFGYIKYLHVQVGNEWVIPDAAHWDNADVFLHKPISYENKKMAPSENKQQCIIFQFLFHVTCNKKMQCTKTCGWKWWFYHCRVVNLPRYKTMWYFFPVIYPWQGNSLFCWLAVAFIEGSECAEIWLFL